MSKQYFSLLTNYGTQAFAKAIGNKTPIPITHMAVGDGNGQNVTPNATQSALVKEVYRAGISSMSVDPRNNKQIIFELIIPENIGGFYVREMGIYDNANKLVAVANCPESFKPTLESGSGKVQVMRMILKVSSADAVTITMNNAIYATQTQLNPKTISANSINRVDDTGHSHDIDDATLEQAGIVQLTNDINSDSEKLALTAKAGKALKALIDAITRNLANYIPNSKKSNAIDSTSSDNVATSWAAKKAYDKAVEAENLAESKYTAQNASVTQRGITQHYSGYDSDREDLSASAKVIKILKGFIDSNTRNFSNYIPNSKKSSATNSNSADTVATSAAVKSAYDLAAGAVPLAGDATITGNKRFEYRLWLKVHGDDTNYAFWGANQSHMHLYNPISKMWLYLHNNGLLAYGSNKIYHEGQKPTPQEIGALPQTVFDLFRNKFSYAAYNGNSSSSVVFRVPLTDDKGFKIYASLVTIGANQTGHRFRLSEEMRGFRTGFVVGTSNELETYNVVFENDSSVLIYCPVKARIQIVNLLLIGEYQY